MVRKSHFPFIAMCMVTLGWPAVALAQNQSTQNSRDRYNSTMNAGDRDSRITDMVQNRLYGSVSLDGSDIQVNTRKHTVTLTGKVASEHAKQRAERMARQVPGVYNVENKLQVDSQLGNSRQSNVPDDQLARDAAQAIARELQANADQDWLYGWDVSKNNWEIEVDADGGIVTLSGDAQSYSDMNRAAKAARKVAGVRAVRNHIGLSWESQDHSLGYPYYGYGWGYPYGYGWGNPYLY